jgi:RNA recognition motif-containing protein
MSKKMYVGNMNYSTTEETLNTLFAEFGSVTSVKIITEPVTNRSRGFGFVEMENDEDADKAINALNGKEVDGRMLKINEARDKNSGDGGNNRNKFRRGGQQR